MAINIPPTQCMMSRREGLGNVGFKRFITFLFDSVAAFFNVDPLEMRREIILFEAKEMDDPPYYFDSKSLETHRYSQSV